MRLTDALELVRAPNILTAPADVGMGLAVSGAAFDGSAVMLSGPPRWRTPAGWP